MIYSHFERASLKISDFEAKFDLEFEKPSASAQGGPGGTPGKAAGRPGGFRGAEPPYTPKNYFCPPSKEKFGIFGHFELGKCGFRAILGPRLLKSGHSGHFEP